MRELPSVDIENDELFTVFDLCEELPKPPTANTRWRWIRKGIRGVKLPAVRVNGVWCTTRAAFAAFLRAQSDAQLATTKRRTSA